MVAACGRSDVTPTTDTANSTAVMTVKWRLKRPRK